MVWKHMDSLGIVSVPVSYMFRCLTTERERKCKWLQLYWEFGCIKLLHVSTESWREAIASLSSQPLALVPVLFSFCVMFTGKDFGSELGIQSQEHMQQKSHRAGRAERGLTKFGTWTPKPKGFVSCMWLGLGYFNASIMVGIDCIFF